MLLYAVTDRAWTGERTLYQQVEEALRGGATCVQLREKDLGFDEFLREAVDIGALCRSYGVPFIVNDNVEIAMLSNAAGVHIGQHDEALIDVRRKVGDGMIVGVSAQTAEQAVEAEKNGADYIGAGAVFVTGTKPDAEAITRETLYNICHSVSIPVVAIGGINGNNIQKLAGAGISGVAVVSAIFASPDIEAQCKKLRAASEKTVNG